MVEGVVVRITLRGWARTTRHSLRQAPCGRGAGRSAEEPDPVGSAVPWTKRRSTSSGDQQARNEEQRSTIAIMALLLSSQAVDPYDTPRPQRGQPNSRHGRQTAQEPVTPRPRRGQSNFR